jgi:ankyrin repeat protein
MLPIPNRPVRPGRLTLLCVAGSVALLLIGQAPFFEGPGGLALIIPWLAVLGMHLLLGPIALHAAWKQGHSLANPFIYLYFLIFAGAHAWFFLHGSGLDREMQSMWRRHGNPLEAQLHSTLQELEMRKAGGVAPVDPAKTAVALQFVRRGADCNYRGLHARPFLVRACALGLDEVALAMLQHGADPRAAAGTRVTPLHAAPAECSPDVVDELLRLGAEPDARDAWQNTPLILAVRAGRAANVATLLARRPAVDAPDQNRQTPLLEAVVRDDAPMVGALLQAGADPNGRELGGRSVLTVAAGAAGQDVVGVLLERGAVLNAPVAGRDLPLRESLQKGRLDDADALLRIGANVNAPTAGGDTLLAEVAGFHVSYSAGASDKHDLLAWLLRHGADPDGRDRKGRTPLQIASAMADGKSVDLLLQAGAKP